MPSAEAKITIAASMERIFDRLSQPLRAPEWVPNLVSVDLRSDIASGPGLEAGFIARAGARELKGMGKLVAWDPPKYLVLELATDDGLSGTSTFQLAVTAEGTGVAMHLDYAISKKGLTGLAGGLLGGVIARRELRKALELLKRHVEAEAASESPTS